jgi:hypothetical protein
LSETLVAGSDLLVFGGRRLAEDAFISRGTGMKCCLAVGCPDVDLGRAAANIDVTRRPDTEPDAQIVHRQDGDFDILGEFNGLANFPA